MSHVEKLLKALYVPAADIKRLTDSENTISDEDYNKILAAAKEKANKEAEATILKDKKKGIVEETYQKSALKFRKSLNRTFNLGYSDAELSDFVGREDDFIQEFDSKMEEKMVELREGAGEATKKELAEMKRNYTTLQKDFESHKEAAKKELEDSLKKKDKEMELTMAQSYFDRRLASKKIDKNIPAIGRITREIRRELFETAKVDRDGKIIDKDDMPVTVDGKVVDTVDEYLDAVLEKEDLLVVNNSGLDDTTARTGRRRKPVVEESEAVKNKRLELENARRRANKSQGRF